MDNARAPVRPPLIDPLTGRLRPLLPEERRARSEALRRTLDAIAEITDENDTDEVWDEVLRNIAAERGDDPPGTKVP